MALGSSQEVAYVNTVLLRTAWVWQKSTPRRYSKAAKDRCMGHLIFAAHCPKIQGKMSYSFNPGHLALPPEKPVCRSRRTGHGTMDWFQIGKGVHQGCILSPCLFNLYAEYIMRNTREVPNSPFFMRLNLLSRGFQELNSYGGRDYSSTNRNIMQATHV